MLQLPLAVDSVISGRLSGILRGDIYGIGAALIAVTLALFALSIIACAVFLTWMRRVTR